MHAFLIITIITNKLGTCARASDVTDLRDWKSTCGYREESSYTHKMADRQQSQMRGRFTAYGGLTVTVTASWIGRPLWILRNVTPFKVRQVIFDKVWSQFFFCSYFQPFFKTVFETCLKWFPNRPEKLRTILVSSIQIISWKNKKVILVFSWPARPKNFGTRASNNVRPLHFSRGFSPPSISPDCAFSLFLVSFFFLRINAGGRLVFTKRF